MNLPRIGLSLVCLAFGGCSYAFVQPALVDHGRRTWVDCTSSRLAPIADVAGAIETAGGALVLELLSGLGSIDYERDEPRDLTGLRAMQLGLVTAAVVEVASAAYGFRHTAKCEQAKDQLQMRVNRSPTPAACIDDADCKSDRRCVGGACTWQTQF